MALFDMNHPWVFFFGLLGNLISLAVYFAPVLTFRRILKRKSTEGFQSVPYVVALFSAMLWIYYAILKTNSILLISINAAGCVIETIYIIMFIIYAPMMAKISTAKLILLLNIGTFCLILTLTLLLTKGAKRVEILGWVCVGVSVTVFAAPLSIMRLVMRTRSVEFMPFSLSLSLTLSAMAWLAYGVVTKDIYVGMPNVLGFFFGLAQMLLYSIYKNTHKDEQGQEHRLPELVINIVKLSSEVHPFEAKQTSEEKNDDKDQKPHEETDYGNEKSMGNHEEIELNQV